jgi:NAD(P)-dependent dehydrogenase (short-subunit alcohol dehydrogenase family)
MTETIVITGGSSGIGAAAARVLRQRGATVAITGRSPVAPADALRDAQLAAIRKSLPPWQWSAFALMGSASALPVPARTHAELAAK